MRARRDRRTEAALQCAGRDPIAATRNTDLDLAPLARERGVERSDVLALRRRVRARRLRFAIDCEPDRPGAPPASATASRRRRSSARLATSARSSDGLALTCGLAVARARGPREPLRRGRRPALDGRPRERTWPRGPPRRALARPRTLAGAAVKRSEESRSGARSLVRRPAVEGRRQAVASRRTAPDRRSRLRARASSTSASSRTSRSTAAASRSDRAHDARVPREGGVRAAARERVAALPGVARGRGRR